jgi:glycosyltransferase involved in cell wall biosynthesis
MITVVFATRNGARTLPDVLDAYRGLVPPDGGWKLIVVDNGSTDESREIVASYKGILPLTCLFEERPGKNAALNAAIGQVAGDLAVFTDDDVFPRPDWLVRLREAADARPGYSVFGGTVLPRWEVPPPQWVLEWVPLSVAFALTPPSLEEGPTTSSNVFGPNMAVRTAAFEQGYRFDASIGPRGTRYAMGSETELVRRLVSRGHGAWHVRDAKVEHFIRAHQIEKGWILGRAVRFGRGQYRLERLERPLQAASWFGIPRYLFRMALEQGACFLGSAVVRNREACFRSRWQLNYYRGQIMEAGDMQSRKVT